MQTSKLSNKQLIMVSAIFATFMGQIYIKPFDMNFRLTLAVIGLNFIIVFLDDLPILILTSLIGVLMTLTRALVYTFGEGASFITALNLYYPVYFFYLFYGLLFVFLHGRQMIIHPFRLFIIFWVCDGFPNIIEFVIRRGWRFAPLEQGLYTIVLIALIRSLFTISGILLSKHFFSIYKERQVHSEFVNKIMLAANLKTELFFLRKSKKDIEKAMNKSYDIYQALDDDSLKQNVLNVTKDIHEIKKDYTRVIAGIEKTVTSAPVYNMSVEEIVDIVIESNRNVAIARNKNIIFNKCVYGVMRTRKFYGLISIIDNLVINAIEAIDKNGIIEIVINVGETLMIKIIDNGSGISAEDLDLIYTAGFSTKYNTMSGVMNAGVGLTHVKHIVADVFSGRIDVVASKDNHTAFRVMIPIQKLLKGDDLDEL